MEDTVIDVDVAASADTDEGGDSRDGGDEDEIMLAMT